MDPGSSLKTREERAARNQDLFRTVNEKLKSMNEAFSELVGDTYAITCECADLDCIVTLEIAPGEYEAVRAEGSHFVVLRGHVYPEVERVVREHNGYVIVQKTGAAQTVAEARDPRG